MKKVMTFNEAIRETLDEILEENPNVILIGEDIKAYGGAYGTTQGLYEKYGDERVLSTPLSESAFIGAAVGAAQSGLRPIVELSSNDLITFGMDPLINQAAKTYFLSNGSVNVPLVLRLPSGSAEGSGPSQSQNFENIFAAIPGLKVVSPSTPAQAKGLLKAAVEDNNPVIFIENRDLYETEGPVPDDKDYKIPLSESLIEHPGSDVTIVSWGPVLQKVKEVVSVLEREGLSAEIINPLTLSPMDMQPIFESVLKTSRLVIVHDGPKSGGIGSEIAARVMESDCFDYLDAPIIRVAGADIPVPFSQNLKKQTTVNKEDIYNAIYTVTGMN